MHQRNEKMRIGENAKVTEHDPDFENAKYEEHLEAPLHHILDINVVKHSRIYQRKLYSKVIQGIGLALHFPHYTSTI